MTLTRTEVRALLDRYEISPKRSLGQNFVVEPNTVRRIAQLAGVGEGDSVVVNGGLENGDVIVISRLEVMFEGMKVERSDA